MGRFVFILLLGLISHPAFGEATTRVGLDQLFYSNGGTQSNVNAATALSKSLSGDIDLGYGSSLLYGESGMTKSEAFSGKLGVSGGLTTFLGFSLSATGRFGKETVPSFGLDAQSTWLLSAAWAGTLPTQLIVGGGANRLGKTDGEYSLLFSGTAGISQALAPTLNVTATYTHFLYGDRYGVTPNLEEVLVSTKDISLVQNLLGVPRNIWTAAVALQMSESVGVQASLSSILTMQSLRRVPDAELRLTFNTTAGYDLGLRVGAMLPPESRTVSEGIYRGGFSFGYAW